jgi:hypothetical protein
MPGFTFNLSPSCAVLRPVTPVFQILSCGRRPSPAAAVKLETATVLF